MGQQFDAEGNPLYGVYDKKGELLIFSKELPDGNYRINQNGRIQVYKHKVPAGFRMEL